MLFLITFMSSGSSIWILYRHWIVTGFFGFQFMGKGAPFILSSNRYWLNPFLIELVSWERNIFLFKLDSVPDWRCPLLNEHKFIWNPLIYQELKVKLDKTSGISSVWNIVFNCTTFWTCRFFQKRIAVMIIFDEISKSKGK